jgi:formate hydrogenlyase regulatory protein HycA
MIDAFWSRFGGAELSATADPGEITPAPEVIPIAHVSGYRTDTIGRYDGGQFFASVTWAFREDYTFDVGQWEEHKLLFAVLHTFDAEGRHRESDIWYAGTQDEQSRLRKPARDRTPVARAEARMAKLLDALPGRAYTDIAIRPFQVVVDGVVFGLVIEPGEGDADGDMAEFYPDELGFGPPWDGSYDT